MATIRLGIDSRPAQQGARQYRDAMGRFVKKPSMEAATSVGLVDNRMKGLKATAASVKGALGGLFAGFAAVSVVRNATGVIAGFEETLATLEGVTGLDKASDSFTALTDKARELGATTRFSAQESAEGLLFLARAGQTAEEQLNSIGPTLDLATAGALGLGQAADFSSNIVAQFGLNAADTARVVDTLVNSANSANTDVTQLAEAMKFAGPIAGALGRSVEETAAAVGVLGDSGIQASMAGTNLRGVMLALAKPTSEAQATIERLGFDMAKLNPETNSLAVIFDELASKTLSAGDASLIFGRRNAAAALVLAQGAEKVRDLTAANEESAGTARKNAALIEDTLAGAYRSLKSAIEEVILQAGDSGLLATLKSVVVTVTDAVRILAGMEDRITGNATAAHTLATVLKAVGVTILALGLLKTAGLFLGLARAILTTVGSVRALSAAFATNPIGVIALAIGLAVVAYDKLKDRTVEIGDETVKVGDIVGGIWDHLVDRFKFMAETIAKIWEIVTKFLGDQWEKLSQFFVDKFQEITEFFGIDWEKIFKFMLSVVKFFVNNSIASLKSVGTVIAEILGALKRAGEALLDFDVTSPISSLQKIGGELDPAKILGNIGTKVGENFTTDYVDAFLKALPGAAETIKKNLNSTFGEGFTDDLNTFFNPTAQIDDIRRRALERARERAAGRAGGEGTDAELEKAKQQLAAINAELAKLDAGSDVNVNVEIAGADEIKGAADNAERLKDNLELVGNGERLGIDKLASNFDELGTSLENVLNDAFSPERLQELARNLSDVFTTAIGEVIDGTKSLDEAFEDVVRGVQQAFVENFLLKPLQGIFDNLFSSVLQGALGGISLGFADGDAFSNGRPHFFNQGTVISSPTTFPLRGGDTGVAGEAGPEAILPLDRDNTGRLGVRASGGGGTTEVNDNRQFNQKFVFPNVRNADDFRPARRQVVRDFKRATDGDRP